MRGVGPKFPVKVQLLRNPERQISYVVKFPTYFRPKSRTGGVRSPAVPLPPDRLAELAKWWSGYQFDDFIFLFGAKRHGDQIVLTAGNLPPKKANPAPRRISGGRGETMTAKTSPPVSDRAAATSEPRVPLEFAWKLRQQFSELSAYLESVQDRKERLYAYLQGAYFLGTFYRECPEEYRRFSDLNIWRGVRQKPKSTTSCVRSWPSRWAQLDQGQTRCGIVSTNTLPRWNTSWEEVLPDDVPQLLKEGGGIDAIYVEACRDAKRSEEPGDDLGETTGEWPLARTGEGTTDTRAVAVQGPLAAREIDGDEHRFYDDRRRLADEGQRKSVPRLTAANEPTDKLRDEVQTAKRSKRGQLPSTLRRIILEVEMFEFELDDVLTAKRATICANVAPPGSRGRRPVSAQLVFTSYSTDGPWPGWPAKKRDDDEEA